MFPSTNSTAPRPPSTCAKCWSPHISFSDGSSRREGITSGRWPVRNAFSATLAARLAERTAAKVARASTVVPAAVASDEIVTQSAIERTSVRERPPPALWQDGCVIIEIRGHDLPGRICGPTPEGGEYEDIHVGLARANDAIGLVAGDAESARWELEVKVKEGPDGGFDCTGPSVFGKPGERHLGLRWVAVGDDGSMFVFRATKLRLNDVGLELTTRAVEGGGRLV